MSRGQRLISGPVYLFDAADTLERVPRDQLVPLTKSYIDFIENLNRYADFVLRFNVNTLAILLIALLFSPLVVLASFGRTSITALKTTAPGMVA